MFERYTERARRVLFFARYEASQVGSIAIESEHLLLGLLREGKGLTGRLFARHHASPEHIRRELESRLVYREKISTSVEIPFTSEVKAILQYAADEADRLLHNDIGTEHLLLGMLRAERSRGTGLDRSGERPDSLERGHVHGSGAVHDARRLWHYDWLLLCRCRRDRTGRPRTAWPPEAPIPC